MCPYTYADTLAHFAHRHICTLYTDTLTQSLQQLCTLTQTHLHTLHTQMLSHTSLTHFMHTQTTHTHTHTQSLQQLCTLTHTHALIHFTHRHTCTFHTHTQSLQQLCPPTHTHTRTLHTHRRTRILQMHKSKLPGLGLQWEARQLQAAPGDRSAVLPLASQLQGCRAPSL